MNTILESLKAYFANNSREKIESDWNETACFDSISPKVDEFLQQTKLLYQQDVNKEYWHFNFKNDFNESPKFSSDFFLYLS